MYTPSSASIGTMRAGGTSAKRGSLTRRSTSARSAGLSAWAPAPHVAPRAGNRPIPGPHGPSSAAECARRYRPSRRPGAAARRPRAPCGCLGPDSGDLRGRSFVLALVEDRRDFFRQHQKRRRLGQGTVLAAQLALELLDAPAVLLGLLRARAGLLGLGQRLRGRPAAKPPAAAGTPRGRGTRRSCRPRPSRPWSIRVQSGRRCPGPLASGPGQRIAAPALQRSRSNPDLTRHVFQHRALRRQQPRHRPVLECLSVSSQFLISSSPPGSRFYRGDNYSDAGGYDKCTVRALLARDPEVIEFGYVGTLVRMVAVGLGGEEREFFGRVNQPVALEGA